MRVGIVAFMHESNTFSSIPTTRRHFEEGRLDFGSALVENWRDAHHEIGGYLQSCGDRDLEAVPILAGWATPGGPLTRETYEGILTEVLQGIDRAGRMDGMLLALHGAMVTESIDSADGETVKRIREKMGADFPIVLSLDMHANVSRPMVEYPNVTLAYRTYPHIDQRQRGVECAQLLNRILREGARPRQAFVKLPLLIHIVRQYSEEGPMKRIFDRVREIADSPGILSASFTPGFAYTDVPDMGASAIVVADGDKALAEEKVRSLAEFAFSLREELNSELPDPAAAVRAAGEAPGTVSLMDCGDNVGGGGPGDSTILLAEVLSQGIPKCCVVLYDPESAHACAEAGEGGTVNLKVGAKTDNRHGEPVAIEGRVAKISDGRFEESEPRHGGIQFFDQGLTAVVVTSDSHTVILNSQRVMPVSLHQLLSVGVRPEDHNILIVKGVTAPRAAYGPVSSKVIPVDTPGVTRAGPESFEFHKRPVPLYPLEPDATL